MPIALLPHSLHMGRGTTRLEKSLRHNKTDCIITFFFFFSPYRVHLYSSHHLQREEWEQKKKKKEKEAEKRTGDLGRRSQYPFLCVCRGILGEKEQKRQKKQMDGGTEWRGERRA